MFQKNIIQKYLNAQNSKELSEKWQQFRANFHNPDKQANIRALKEEQYQEGFLRDLFVAILGYTLSPDKNYNLITEQKNEDDSKKADGAIFDQKGDVIAVIELKGTDTRNLNKIIEQAFNYKNHHANCRYVIIANFQKIRFYIQNATEYTEWDLFNLDETSFKLLYLLLKKDHIQTGLPEKIKAESLSAEATITKRLYADYAAFKRDLFTDLCAQNPKSDKITLFKKSQKLLDRFLFIFFAEDRSLLPPNTIINIIKEWQKLQELDAYVPLYSRIKQYFGYLNEGNERKNIFAYNGGLFKPDNELDTLNISDNILAKHIAKIAEYDFASEIDVNILGHIFENSLNEIEEIHAQLNGETTDKKQSKRKKDGVFYTPKYITQYIVQNTIGKLCTDKKAELGLSEEYLNSFKLPKKETKKEQKAKLIAAAQEPLQKIETYREWLLNITICDPACGSGAFLNEALNFLIAEHRNIDEMKNTLAGGSLVYQDVEHAILERNLYGVDINEESVEIAKLSLWLRTAQQQRKLNNLSQNIVCGNSLISDPKIAGDKAFSFQTAFPKVFEQGGFDVVIGNPPYVRAELLPERQTTYYQNNYQVFTPTGDLFFYFYELGLNLLKANGLFGFISNTFDKTTAGETLRRFIGEQKRIINYLDFTEVQIFEGATTYPVILILANEHEKNIVFQYQKIPNKMQGNIDISNVPQIEVLQSSLKAETWGFHSVQTVKIMEKICQYKTVKEQFGKCYYGVKTGLNEAFIIDEATKNQLIAADKHSIEIIKPVFEGKDLGKWSNLEIGKYLITTHNGYAEKSAINIDDYLAVKNHLNTFYPQLEKRYDKGITPYNLRNCAYQALFEQPKIIWSNLQNSNKFSFDLNKCIINAPACFLPVNNKALLCVLNSKLVWQFLTSICVVRNGGYIEVKPQYFEQIPIPEISNDIQVVLSELAEKMITLNQSLNEKSQAFIRLIARRFALAKVSSKLQNWTTLSFAEFLAELKKAKIKLSLNEELEWETVFTTQQNETQAIATQIQQTDNEIDKQVFKLYGLTEEEIAIIQAA